MKRWCRMSSAIGELVLVAENDALAEIRFPGAATIEDGVQETTPLLEEAVRQLSAYFAGTRRHFDLPLAPRGTPFQKVVWKALGEIPFGEAQAYSDIARRIGNEKAVRAVGLANGRNPIPIVIPCHRVIGRDGSLTGYAGGLVIKRQLLELENIDFRESARERNLSLID